MRKQVKLVWNAPIIIGFTLISFVVTVLGMLTGGWSNDMLFSVYRASLANPLTYLRFVGHVFGHADFAHFLGNSMTILILGPLLEEKYGKANMVAVMLLTAIVTGLVNFIFFPQVQLLGSSGIVFAFILLSSLTGLRAGTVPLTFLLVAVLYLGGEIYQGIFVNDQVSQLTHIVGGGVGAAFGFLAKRKSQ